MNNRSLSFALIVSGVAILILVSACSPTTSSFTPPTLTPTATEVPTSVPTQTPAPQSRGNSSANKNSAAGLPANLQSLGLEGGIVAANSSSELSLKLGKAMQTLPVFSGTLVAIPGKATAQVSDIHVGDRVIADVGQSNASTPARFILDIPQSYTTDNIVAGAVIGRDKAGIQVRARGGDKQVSADLSAVIINMVGGEAKLGSLADVKRGTGVLVIGQPANDAITAQVVVVVDRSTLQGRQNNPVGTPTVTP